MELNNNINNSNFVNKEKKKKKSALFIIVIIYIFLSVVFTICSIFFYKKTGKNIIDYFIKINNIDEISENTNEIEAIVEKNEKKEIEISNLTDKYYLNNIELKKITNEIKEGYQYQDENEKSFKNKIEYYQISGLKDKIVQEKINQDIKQKVESMLVKEEIENEQIDYIWISSNVISNFSNVLSISVFKSVNYKYPPSEEIDLGNSGLKLNYRLDTGEELKLEDLFLETASIKNILSQTLYKNLALNLGWEYATNSDEFLDPNMEDFDYSEIEMEVFRVIDAYNKGKKLDFYFSSSYIYIEIENRTIGIKMSDFYEYISIFNLVNPSKSLYENGNLKKLNYAFSTPYISNCVFFDKITNDIFLSIFSYYDPYNNSEEYEKMKLLLDEKINEITTLIKRNENKEENKNNKGKIYNISYIDNYENNFYATGEKVEVSLENFDKQIDEVYAQACRQEPSVEYMLTLYSLGNGYNVRIEKQKDFDFLTLYEKKYDDIEWTGLDGTKTDIYGNIVKILE